MRRGVVAALAAVTMIGVPLATGVPTPQPAAAQAALEATIEPSSGLVDGDLVTITATGLQPGSFVDAVQCVADPADPQEDCDLTDYGFDMVGPDGTAEMVLRVDAVITTGHPAIGAGREVDCRSSPCTVGLVTQGFAIDASIALSFDPDGPLAPPPTVSVAPDSDLDDLAPVTVEASGLVWSGDAVIMQCVADPAGRDECDTATMMYSPVSDTGSLTVDLRARSLLDIEGRDPVDCRAQGACVVAVTSDLLRSPAKSATAPVSFAPDAEVRTPTLSVTPDSGLVDGQVVTLTGGDHPVGTGMGVEILQCTSQPSYGTCQWLGWTMVDSAGDMTAEVRIRAILPTVDGEVDCRTSDERCQIVAGPGTPSSIRSGRVDLDFAADGPLLPPPAIEVRPSTGLTDGEVVTVTGTDFTPNDHAWVQICVDDDVGHCANSGADSVPTSPSGTFSLDLTVSDSFETWDGDAVDCLVTSCAVRAEDGGGWLAATAPITFAAPPDGGGQRYLDAVFDDVEVTEGIAYRTTTDAHGDAVDLALDLYQPAGDTAEQRPVVVWTRGGWFGTADDGRAAAYAEEFARRGYVVAVVGHRTRPELGCCPTRDALGIAGAISDATADVEAGVAWLRDHAEEHRLDPRAIVAGGTDGGAAVSYGLAYPGQGRGAAGHSPDHPHEPAAHDMGAPGDDAPGAGVPAVAAALPVSGVSVGEPAAGAPPVLAFHGQNDLTAPAHLSEWTCSAARAVDARCDVVVYAGAAGEIGATKQRDIVRRSTAFLAEVVLEPLGYLDPAQAPAPTTTTTTTTTTAGPPAADGDVAAPLTPVADRWPGGDLARTGLDGTLSLARAGAAATLLGAGLLLEARRRRRERGTATEGG